jgi:hypothetical protein
MKVYSECAPLSTERITQMRGKPEDIVKCMQDMLDLLDTVSVSPIRQYLVIDLCFTLCLSFSRLHQRA